MWNIDKAYIDGAFVPVQGTEVVEIANPATEQRIGSATLAAQAATLELCGVLGVQAALARLRAEAVRPDTPC